MPEEIHGQELAAVEAALAALAPLPARIDRDQLMYRAGQSAAPGAGWRWPGLSAGLAALSVTLGAALVLRPAQAPIEHIVYVQPQAPRPAPQASQPRAPEETATAAPTEEADSAAPSTDRLTLQKQVLRWGLDGLPDAPLAAPPEQPLTLDGLLGTPPKQPARPSFFGLETWINPGDQS